MPPSAATSLAGYFSAAADVDQRLRAAADVANSAITRTRIHVNRAVQRAIAAADPASAGRLIPAGLAPKVLLPVLNVQNDLVSRFNAFNGFRFAFGQGGTGTLERTDPTARLRSRQKVDYLMVCLRLGSAPAVSFPADLAAARAAAALAPPPPPVAPSSRTAAEVAIRLEVINEANSGCESCGGGKPQRALTPIRWHHMRIPGPGGHWDGDIAGVPFVALYSARDGWEIHLGVC